MTLDELNARLEEVYPGASELKALSIRQPWCVRILEQGKDIENRSTRFKFRGPLLIHAGLTIDPVFSTHDEHDAPQGGIVGIMDIVDCVSESDSPWFQGPYGLVIENARALPFIPCKGALSFFKPKPYEGSP